MRILDRSTFWAALTMTAMLFAAAEAGAQTPVRCLVPAPQFTQGQVRDMIVKAAEKDGRVPTALALAVARIESNFNAGAESSAGARGVMQIMPATARDEYSVDADKLWDAQTNIDLGVRFLGDLYEKYERDWDAALSHYNGGALKDGLPHMYTADYVASVNRWWRIYDNGARTPALFADRETTVRETTVRDAPEMSQEALEEHIMSARERVRAALARQGAYD